MPLASGPGRVALVVVLPLLVFDVGVDGIGYGFVGAARLVLLDHRGPFGVVAHPSHQVAQARTAVGRELVSGVAQVMEVQARHADRRDRLRPGRRPVEVAAAQWTTHDTWEDQRARFVFDVDRQVLCQVAQSREAARRPPPLAPW